MEYDRVDVHVKDGVVYLSGHILSTTARKRIESAIQPIPGIMAIENKLVLDDQLIPEVAAALGNLEHIYGCKFFTGASHGVVSLNGIVGNENIKLLAEQCVSSNPHVRGVINNVRIFGSKQELQAPPFLQPSIGEVVYFLDGISGIVKYVIINPNNRLVVAMIIQGKFTDPQYQINSLSDRRLRLPEQLVTVPMSMVRYLTRVSGFLNINSDERKRYMDFDPGHFFVPNKNWVPPYPYCLGEILFPVEYQNADMQAADKPDQFPFGAVVEDAAFREQFFSTNSAGL